GPDTPPELIECFIEARRAVHDQLIAENLSHLVETFDPNRYNVHATIGENLLFGILVGDGLDGNMAADPYVRSILEAEALDEPLIELGLRIAEVTAEMFAGLPPGHPLFER